MTQDIAGLIIRQAEPQDKKAVIAFCKDTWEDGDYIHSVFDRWVSQQNRVLLTAEFDAVPIGIASFVKLDAEQGWLEGLRVDPKHRGKGVATALNAELTGVIEHSGVSKVRFATHGKNEPVHKMAGEMGFFEISAFCAVEHAGAGKRHTPLQRLDESALPLLAESVPNSALFEASKGLYGHNWGWRELTQDRLRYHLGRGEVLFTGDAANPDAWAISTHEDEEEGLIGWLDGYPEAAAELAGLLPRDPAFAGRKAVYGVPPAGSYAQDSYLEAGFDVVASDWGEIWIFERILTPETRRL